MIITTYAYPRAALIGNPSDGYFGRTIAFVFKNYYASAQVYETPELKLLPCSRDKDEFANLRDLDEQIGSFGYYGGMRLLKAALRQFYKYCNTNNIALADKNFTMRYESNIPNRLGLAGSSAIITAAMRAVCKFYGVECSNAVLANIVLAAERDELSIPAGLQDRVAQAFNHPVYMDFDREHMEKYGYGIYRKIDIPQNINWYIAYRTDLAEGSEILHSRLRGDFEMGVPKVLDAVREWAELTEKMRIALESGDYAAVPVLINRNFDLRCEVCADSISANNRKMVEIARQCGASAKFTGSGGAIIGTYENDAMFEQMRRELGKFKVEIIRPQIVTGGEASCETLS